MDPALAKSLKGPSVPPHDKTGSGWRRPQRRKAGWQRYSCSVSRCDTDLACRRVFRRQIPTALAQERESGAPEATERTWKQRWAASYQPTAETVANLRATCRYWVCTAEYFVQTMGSGQCANPSSAVPE